MVLAKLFFESNLSSELDRSGTGSHIFVTSETTAAGCFFVTTRAASNLESRVAKNEVGTLTCRNKLTTIIRKYLVTFRCDDRHAPFSKIKQRPVLRDAVSSDEGNSANKAANSMPDDRASEV